jgi:hypothetical protein
MEQPWRFLGAMEAISGVLMLGLSTAMLSNVFSKLLQLRRKRSLFISYFLKYPSFDIDILAHLKEGDSQF